MRNKILTSIALLIFLTNKGVAQDAHFSQFYANPLYLAPSFAGSSHETRFVGAFRDQWPKIPGNFVTYSFSVDHFLPKFNSGFALFVLSDNAGDGKLVTNNISFSYSYKIKINRKLYFQPGLAAYYYSRKIDYSMVSFADEYFGKDYVGATSEVLPNYKVQHADFAVSGLVYSDYFWTGFNVDHLMTLSPILRDDFRYSDIRVSVFGGYKIPIIRRTRNKNKEYIHAAFNYTFQSNIHQLDLGAYYNRFPFIIGMWYRGLPIINEYATSDALIYLFGFKYKELTFSYSFDMTLGNLISQTGGSHEITAVYTLSSKSLRKKYKAMPCPEM